MNLCKNIKKSIIDIALKYPNVKKITLFGSRARGDNHERSDIDLAVYFFDKLDYNIISAFDEIETLLKIDVTIMTNTLDKEFNDNVKNEEIVIFMGKFENKYSNYKKAVSKLAIIVEEMDIADEIIRDSLIQRFEFCYELAWKTLKEYLQYNGLMVESMPRPVFKAAYENNIIDHEQIWLEMIKDKNIASHEYNEEYAIVVANNIKDKYYNEFVDLVKRFEK